MSSLPVEDAKLYTRPLTPPMIVGAAITPATAGWVAGWADALITVARPIAELQNVVDAFRDGGGQGKPILLQAQLSYGPTGEEALRAAHEQWRTNILDSPVLSGLRMPADFEAVASFVGPDDVVGPVLVSADLSEHLERIQELLALDVDEILLHNVHRDQETFIRDFADGVLPELDR